MSLEDAMSQIEELERRIEELEFEAGRARDYFEKLERTIDRLDDRLREEERARENAIYNVERDVSNLERRL